ncbi:hypothetical protein [Thermoflexibacter ruber]|uniref:Uncharacterized protein n=1 Tax=Thermoflexibacter ruber TaxID=1003 RepID=A0A1I2F3L1_9BACT|nr:hypothetical protein [Thermoflexibacter ruber]SFE99298.1 hypothetical protein SAMN04488541_101241 [Thermoflexibacter ruber]
MKYQDLREEELKNKVAKDYFWLYDCTRIIGNVDFCVAMHQSHPELYESTSLVWAEAKKGKSNLYHSLVQLILTIGKARTFDKHLPPPYLAAFDAEAIAFVPYNDIQEVFYLNDFNWNVTPSNYDTKEFSLLYEKVKNTIDQKALLFRFTNDDKELQRFIKKLAEDKFGTTKIRIDKNNFLVIYNKWLQIVKPTIAVNWEIAKKQGIIDGDFYLADLLSQENITLKEKLFVLLRKDHYQLDRKIDEAGMFNSKTVDFKDKQVAHNQFWNRYERPPKEQYWDYIVQRRDLLVPQDVRERKGSFFTPQIWVELSQRYLAKVLGENWQDEYYIWDCAAGTGNLLAGLTNKYHIWASTLDKQDVEVMHDRINNGTNLLHDHVFQFDFLNDEFLPKSKGGKLPDSLYKILTEEGKRKKLVIYINPPYAESNSRVSTKRSEVQNTKIYQKYNAKLGKARAELYIQFLMRIYAEIPDSYIAQFSKFKAVCSGNSKLFRSHFLAKNEKTFAVPANTFDNVKGKFPIGFFIWNTQQKEKISTVSVDIYDAQGKFMLNKNFYANDDEAGRINDWLDQFAFQGENGFIGVLVADAPDFQNNNFIAIQNSKGIRHGKYFYINKSNLIFACIYFAVRHCIKATWLNDRDQFLYPNSDWEKDTDFQNDCLAFTLFHGQNKISSQEGTNHWIPFTEREVNAREKFDSNFIPQFIEGKLKKGSNGHLFEKVTEFNEPLIFSKEAQAVFEAGRELWRYYHSQNFIEGTYNPNASLYDIKAYFQGRDEKDKMNNKSIDETFNALLANLRESLNKLAQKIEPKVYEYGFLKR